MAKQLPVIAVGVVVSVEMVDCEIEGWVWPQSAKRQQKAGKLKAILDSDGVVVAYQRVAQPIAMLREDKERSSSGVVPVMARSSASITPKEMMLYAGRHFKDGGSRTADMKSDLERAQQEYPALTMKQIERGKHVPTGKPPMEDAVELVVAKVNSFAPVRGAAA